MEGPGGHREPLGRTTSYSFDAISVTVAASDSVTGEGSCRWLGLVREQASASTLVEGTNSSEKGKRHQKTFRPIPTSHMVRPFDRYVVFTIVSPWIGDRLAM